MLDVVSGIDAAAVAHQVRPSECPHRAPNFFGIGLGLVCLSALVGCADPVARAQQHAKDVCAAQGKQPYIVDSRVTDSALGTYRLASLQLHCVDPNDLVSTGEVFGAELLAEKDVKGAIILKVRPGSVAGNAGLQHLDVVVEYAGRSIENAAALQTEVAHTTEGARVLIKLHRNQQDVSTTAQF